MSQVATSLSAFTGNTRRGAALLELCEQVFLYVCRINRANRVLGADILSHDQVRGELRTLLVDLDRRTLGTDLADPFSRARLPLIFFIDEVITHSGLPFASRWQSLAADEGEPLGNEKFFDLLDIALDDASPAAADLLQVYFVAIGLGFEGRLRGNRQALNDYQARITARIGSRMVLDEAVKICPEAYHHTDRRPLAEPVIGKVFQIALAAAVLVVLAIAINGALYFLRTKTLKQDLQQFHQQVQSANKPERLP